MALMADAAGNLTKSKAFMDKTKYDLPVYSVNSVLPHALFSGSILTKIIIDKQSYSAVRQIGELDCMSKEVMDGMKKLLE